MGIHVLTLVGAALQSLTTVSLGPLALAVVFHLAKIAAEARSWHNILVHSYPRSGLRFRTTLGAFMGMIGANAVLPARIGTALRLGIVCRNRRRARRNREHGGHPRLWDRLPGHDRNDRPHRRDRRCRPARSLLGLSQCHSAE